MSMGGERLDTRNPTSKLMLTILAGVATWERDIMLERMADYPGRAQARGVKEALERFTHDYLPTLKPTSQQRYRTSFRQPDTAFGNLFLDEISRSRLAD